MKIYYFTTIMVISCVVLFARHNEYAKAEEEIPRNQVPTNVVVSERIASQVSLLSKLSTVETLQLLDRMEYYEWPGASIGAGTIFLTDTNGDITSEGFYDQHRISMEKILSNRVFRKSLADLSKLPRNQASELLVKELNIALRKYQELYSGFVKTQSLDFNILASKDGKPVLRGLRNKVFALMLIAGSLELTDVHKNVNQIVDIAQKQRANVSQMEDPNIRSTYFLSALLDNNLVLASSLYGTVSHKEDTKLKPFADRFTDHQLVDYSAFATEYDMFSRVQTLKPDKEYINVRYFDQMTDKDLGELCRILCRR